MFSFFSRSGVWMIPSCDPRWRLPSWPHCPAPGKPAARNPLHWREGAEPCRNVRCGMFGVAVRPRYRWYNIIDRYTHYVKGERWDPEERRTKPSEGLIFLSLFLIHTSTKLGEVIVMFTGVWFVVSSSEATWAYTPNYRSRGEIPKILKLAWGKAFVEVVAMWRLACV